MASFNILDNTRLGELLGELNAPDPYNTTKVPYAPNIYEGMYREMMKAKSPLRRDPNQEMMASAAADVEARKQREEARKYNEDHMASNIDNYEKYEIAYNYNANKVNVQGKLKELKDRLSVIDDEIAENNSKIAEIKSNIEAMNVDAQVAAIRAKQGDYSSWESLKNREVARENTEYQRSESQRKEAQDKRERAEQSLQQAIYNYREYMSNGIPHSDNEIAFQQQNVVDAFNKYNALASANGWEQKDVNTVMQKKTVANGSDEPPVLPGFTLAELAKKAGNKFGSKPSLYVKNGVADRVAIEDALKNTLGNSEFAKLSTDEVTSIVNSLGAELEAAAKKGAGDNAAKIAKARKDFIDKNWSGLTKKTNGELTESMADRIVNNLNNMSGSPKGYKKVLVSDGKWRVE